MSSEPATVAVISTVLNEIDSIDEWIRSLLGQTHPPSRIVIVDGGSTDGTYERLQQFASTDPKLTVVRLAGSSISAGRNHAIALTVEPIIAASDAGTVVDRQWLEILTAQISSDEADVVGGHFTSGGRNFIERLLATVTRPSLAEVDESTFLPSSRCVAFKRECWEDVGGYPEWLTYCEDLVFDMATAASGFRIRFEPKAVVSWAARPSLRSFARQFFRYARGDGHAGLYPWRHCARFGSYSLLFASARFAKPLRPIMLLSGAIYLAFRPWRRLVIERYRFTAAEVIAATGLVPVIAVTGDVSKMIGYVVGRWQRSSVRPPWYNPDSSRCNERQMI